MNPLWIGILSMWSTSKQKLSPEEWKKKGKKCNDKNTLINTHVKNQYLECLNVPHRLKCFFLLLFSFSLYEIFPCGKNDDEVNSQTLKVEKAWENGDMKSWNMNSKNTVRFSFWLHETTWASVWYFILMYCNSASVTSNAIPTYGTIYPVFCWISWCSVWVDLKVSWCCNIIQNGSECVEYARSIVNI